MTTCAKRKIGVIIGGSGLIGGTIVHYFQTKTDIDIRAPSSKKLSVRSANDISSYIDDLQPQFIINAAITTLNSKSSLALEVNYLGALNLARLAAARGIPYIHLSTAAVLPFGDDLEEHHTLPIGAELNNYAKSKLLAEKALALLREKEGLDYSIIRLAIVYGAHDHKIQGFHRLLYSVVDQAMPFLFTARGIRHSYTNSRKVPYFVHHMLENREEFSGNIYHFVDRDPVELGRLILAIRDHLHLKLPRKIYVPYNMTQSGKRLLAVLLRGFAKLGLIARMPQELMFLESFYNNQTLSTAKLRRSSYTDPFPQESIFSLLPDLAAYYLTRWSEQNLIEGRRTAQPLQLDIAFREAPTQLLDLLHEDLASGMSSSDMTRK